MANSQAGDAASVADTPTPVADAEPTAEVESAPTKQTADTSVEAPEKAETTTEADVEGKVGEEGDEPSIPYSRFKEVNDRLRDAEKRAQLLDALKTNPQLAEQFLRESGNPVTTDPALGQADAAIKQLGYMKSSEVQTFVEDAILRHDAEKDFVSEMQRLEKSYDGTKGEPKFDPQEVAKFMDDNGISKPEVAYEVMNKDALADFRAKAKKKGVYSERPGQPMSSGDNDYEAKLEEAKRTGDWTGIIKTRLRPKE